MEKADRSVPWRSITAHHADARSSRSTSPGSCRDSAIHEPGLDPAETWRRWSNEIGSRRSGGPASTS
ncbi:Uncharacterised protein [Mycobacteroides abscessus subsp. abscessus]|nr:Uncharacterised protein [Mycobacteroides abscessus subsp. abscessus]